MYCVPIEFFCNLLEHKVRRTRAPRAEIQSLLPRTPNLPYNSFET